MPEYTLPAGYRRVVRTDCHLILADRYRSPLLDFFSRRTSGPSIPTCATIPAKEGTSPFPFREAMDASSFGAGPAGAVSPGWGIGSAMTVGRCVSWRRWRGPETWA
jgi:hypothetical protein